MNTALRADAQRNLGRVLDAAAEVLAEQGLSASVDEIAKRAGVGHGTVFRRFPTKEALVAAVVCKRLEEISATAEDLLDHPDAGEAFEAFVWQMAEVYARDRCIFEGLPLRRDRRGHAGEGPVPRSGGPAAQPGPNDRAVRADLVLRTPMLVGSAILGSSWSPEGEPWRRFVTVVLDGMRLRP